MTRSKVFGQWKIDGNDLVLTEQNKKATRFKFWLDGNQLAVIFPGPKVTVHFRPVHT